MTFNFDMDGTIADFYSVNGWLEDLQNENTRPYEQAKPLVNMSRLARYLNRLQKQGHKIAIISWTSKCGTDEFNAKIADVKLKWLAKHLRSVRFDSIAVIPYGTPKSLYGNGILFDDEERNRNEWQGQAYNEQQIFKVLKANV